MQRRECVTYKEKIEQTHREARATAVALAVVIVAWIGLGFGLAGFDVQLFHTPLWVVGGTVGVLVVTLAVIAVLRYCVFCDFPLDEESDGASEAAFGEAPAPAEASLPAVAPAQTEAPVQTKAGEQRA